MIELFTLASCPMCEVIKKKLQAKNIQYTERKDDFNYVLSNFKTDKFPILKVEENKIITSLTEIKEWVEAQ